MSAKNKEWQTWEYFKKNRRIQAWLPPSLYKWFEDYLEKYSYGASLSEKFKVYIYKLQELEEQGITIANPRAEKQIRQETAQLKAVAVCLNRTAKDDIETWLATPQTIRDRECALCRAQKGKEHFETCQELKREAAEAHKL